MLLAWFALSALLGAGCTWLVRAVARRLDFVSHPNPIVASHTEPVAYMGGVGFALASALTLGIMALSGQPAPVHVSVAIGAVLFLGLGVIDDLLVLKPLTKLGLQVAFAAVAVELGVQGETMGVPVLDGMLSGAVIVTWVNAVNLTDVCDGLVATLTAVSLAALALFLPESLPLCVVGAGAAVGFLALNRAPASIYLGDAGSHLIGFLLAALVLSRPVFGLRPLAAGAMACGVFLFELGFLVVIRARKGLPFWRGSPDHFSLRLQAAGWSRNRVVLVAAVCQVLFGAVAHGMLNTPLSTAWALLGGLTVALLAVGVALSRFEVR